jgi:CheY-like chemotaxis protein
LTLQSGRTFEAVCSCASEKRVSKVFCNNIIKSYFGDQSDSRELQKNEAKRLKTLSRVQNRTPRPRVQFQSATSDAMTDGGRLTIETANVRLDAAYTTRQVDVDPGDYVAIGVSDTGSGMPGDIVAKAIDPFFTTKPVGEGTGLGLSTIYGFVKQTGGHLRIYSEVGHGTTVKLYLPRALQNAVDLEKPKDATPRGQGETILVVEDDATVRMILGDGLEELGYKVLLASDARPAIQILQSNRRIDLMVCDVMLPHINGRKLAEIARASRPDLKVLFVTGYAENATFRGDFLDAGMDMLTKPFALDSLGAKVRTMLVR